MTHTINTVKGLATAFPNFKGLLVAMHECANDTHAPYEPNWKIINVPNWFTNSGVDEITNSFKGNEVKFLVQPPSNDTHHLRGEISGLVRINGPESSWLFLLTGVIIRKQPEGWEHLERPTKIQVACYFDAVTKTGFILMPSKVTLQIG